MGRPGYLRILTLNTWGGKMFDNLIGFLKSHTDDIDVFCFQEVFSSPAGYQSHSEGTRNNLYEELQRTLIGYQGWFFPVLSNISHPWSHPNTAGELAIFVRRPLHVIEARSVMIHGDPREFVLGQTITCPRNMGYVSIRTGEDVVSVANYHGLWNGKGKGDDPNRFRQSLRLNTALQAMPGAKVICGDLNLRPDTKSFRLLSGELRDLITEKGITNTRSSVLYEKPERFADYILVDKTAAVESFEVLEAHMISDHLPLTVEIAVF